MIACVPTQVSVAMHIPMKCSSYSTVAHAYVWCVCVCVSHARLMQENKCGIARRVNSWQKINKYLHDKLTLMRNCFSTQTFPEGHRYVNMYICVCAYVRKCMGTSV